MTTPRRPRHYFQRSIYVAALLVFMGTAWLIVAGTQDIRSVGDMARFGALLFQILAPLQLAMIAFLSALVAASSISQEKDRRTFVLLLLTRLTNSELVLGKLLASLLDVMAMIIAGLPVLLLITLFGGVSADQVLNAFGITATTALATGSLGALVALWREKTFQTLAMTALIIVLWLGFWQAVHSRLFFENLGGIASEQLATIMSPVPAILAASQPTIHRSATAAASIDPIHAYMFVATAGALVLNLISIAMVRVWNPSREIQPRIEEESPRTSIWSNDAEAGEADSAELARRGHVDERMRGSQGTIRQVWNNPVLWREICTWAYGRKVILIRFAYAILLAGAVIGLSQAARQARTSWQADEAGVQLPAASRYFAPIVLVSLVIVNSLAVNSITNERDGNSLEILLVTDLTPKEFVLGKMFGVLYVTSFMVLAPFALCIYLFTTNTISGEGIVLLMLGLGVLLAFVDMLGIHCGMNYYNSRNAIGISLGTVFFLFLGIATCMVIMISFSGSFQTQLIAFSLINLGGGIGLYAALDYQNRSNAILLAAITLPFWTFFAITSFLLKNYLTMFLVGSGIFGFTTLAMLVPAIHEFDIAMGRTRAGGED